MPHNMSLKRKDKCFSSTTTDQLLPGSNNPVENFKVQNSQAGGYTREFLRNICVNWRKWGSFMWEWCKFINLFADEHAARWVIQSDSALEAFQRRSTHSSSLLSSDGFRWQPVPHSPGPRSTTSFKGSKFYLSRYNFGRHLICVTINGRMRV